MFLKGGDTMRVLRPATTPVKKVNSGRIMKTVPGNLN
ncbi:hypothetical protein JOD25_002900 [Kurthia huakuii]|nr:hypothetical protein [Kurthia huakuii]